MNLKGKKLSETSAEVNHLVIQNRIIEDIKEMDMDNLKGLIEFMYPVTVSDKEGEEGETLILKIQSNNIGLTLDLIF